MSFSEQDAQNVLAMSDDELYLGLGREVSGADGTPQSLETVVKRGKDAFNEFRTRLRPQLCGTDGPRKALSDLGNIAAIPAIGAAILALNLPGIGAGAALYAAALVARMGLDKYCEGYVPAASG